MRRTRDVLPTELSIPHILAVGLVAVLLLSSCATRRAALPETHAEEDHEPASILSERSRALDRLNRAVEDQIATAQDRRLEDESRIRAAPPYFYKRFELYPAGTGDPEIRLKETDSYLKPYEADVSVRKARFTTRYHVSRSACARDKEFVRDIGTQTDTYVYENRQWNLVYSLFEVEETSVLSGDTWTGVTGKVERVAQDGAESFFGKLGGFFLGRAGLLMFFFFGLAEDLRSLACLFFTGA